MKINEMLKIRKDIYDSYEPNKEDINLYKRHPHLFALGCVMDSQIDADKAWSIPKLFANEVGGFDFRFSTQKGEQFFIQLFKEKNHHRFNGKMGEKNCFVIYLLFDLMQ